MVVIVAVGVSLAVPSYQDIVQKRRITNGAMEIAAFLALTHGAAIKSNKPVAVSIKRESDGDVWCLGAMIKTTDDDHCDCESNSPGDGNYCDFNPEGAGAPMMVNQVGYERFTMNDSRVAGTSNNDFNFNFDPVRGVKLADDGITVDGNNHDITLLSTNDNYSLRVSISVTGRVSVCSPDSAKKVPGFDDVNCRAVVIVNSVPG